MKISFVLLIKILSHHDHNELDRLKNIQLKSFRKFLDVSLLKDFFIVASQKDIQVLKDDLLNSYPELPFVFIDEDVLCPSLKGSSGWTKQMILKIVIANIVSTDYYLTLDTDVFLTKALTERDILHDGKLIYQKENPRTHIKWWKSSCRVLQTNVNRVLEKNFVMGVTPEYLVTDVCRKLQFDVMSLNRTEDFASWLMALRISKKNTLIKIIKKLSELMPGITSLMPQARRDQIKSCDWTEYTLYWAYLIKSQLLDSYYIESDLQVYGNCLWGEEDIRRNDLPTFIDRTFTDNSGYHFSIIQSSIKNLDQVYLAKLIGRYLD